MKAVALAFATALGLALAGAPHAAAAGDARCDEACLRRFTQLYIDALARRDPSSLPLASSVKFTENGQALKLGDGLWKTASAVGAYRFFIEDASTSQAAFIGVVDQGGAPAILWLRLKITSAKIAEIETIVARKGSHPLFAPEAFTTPNAVFTQEVPAESRLSRKRLIAIATTYLDGVEKHDSAIVLADPACNRIENGVQTTHRPERQSAGCASSADKLTYIKRVDQRRFPIVDRKHGVVLSVFTFDIPGEAAPPTPPPRSDAAGAQLQATLRKPRTLLLVELFKIAGGKIQHIEAVMHNLPHGGVTGW